MTKSIFTQTRWLVTIITFLIFCTGNAWADYMELTTTSLNISGTGYSSNSTGKSISSIASVKWTDIQESSSGVLGIRNTTTSGIWNSTAMPYNIDSVVLSSVSYSSSNPSSIDVYGAASEKGTTTKIYTGTGTGKIKVDFTAYSYKYFYIKRGGTSRVAKTTSIKVYYTAAACNANPSTGNASINGSFS